LFFGNPICLLWEGVLAYYNLQNILCVFFSKTVFFILDGLLYFLNEEKNWITNVFTGKPDKVKSSNSSTGCKNKIAQCRKTKALGMGMYVQAHGFRVSELVLEQTQTIGSSVMN
jgi:hypothetical protein